MPDQVTSTSSLVVAVDTWAGIRTYAVSVIGETPTKYRVRATTSMMLPGKRHFEAGAEALVPKYAVRTGIPTEEYAYDGGIYGYAELKPTT